MSLKEITKDLHTEAERTDFAKKLIKGTLTKEEYAFYLWQMVLVYGTIENNLDSEILDQLPGIERTHKIHQDFSELMTPKHQFTWVPSAVGYHLYLMELARDPDKKHLIKAHMYVRHMGDLFGGQIIANRVPGTGRFYQFDDTQDLKLRIRALMTDDLGQEARTAFEWAIKIMKEIHEHNMEQDRKPI